MILVVCAGVVVLFLLYLGGGPDSAGIRAFPGGLVPESMYVSGDNLQPAGSVYGFPAVSRTEGRIPVKITNEDAGRLGIVRLVISLFIGDTGAIDMDHLRIEWNSENNHEIISRSTGYPFVCPNWTISDKYNLLPGRTADSDNWLEPGEQFEILLCPQEGIPPYGKFSVVLTPDGVAIPLKISRTVPFNIQPVMNLG
jgi:hypothetical protein